MMHPWRGTGRWNVIDGASAELGYPVLRQPASHVHFTDLW
jgi:hypothetical protein